MTNNEMSIRLLPGGLIISGVPIEIAPGPDRIQQIKEALLSYLEQNPIIPDTVTCEVCTGRITLIPSDERDNSEQMFRLVLPDTERPECILSAPMVTPQDETEGADFPLLLFGIDSELLHFLERNLPQVTFTHPAVHQHSIFCQRSRQFSRPVLFAHADEEAMSLFLYDNQRLQLAMRYETTSVANRSYYLLNTWQQMQLDQQLDHLLLIGQPANINQLRARVAQFIKRTEMMIVNDN